jgi:hypothetical protein
MSMSESVMHILHWRHERHLLYAEDMEASVL